MQGVPVPVLQISADQPGAGKTCLAGALLLHLAESGRRAGYYKPFSNHPGEDPDLVLATQSLLDGQTSVHVAQPLPLPQPASSGPVLPSTAAEQVQLATAELQRQCDWVVLEGPDVAQDGEPSPMALEVSTLTGSKVLLMVRYVKGLTPADVERAAGPFADRLAGVLINGVTQYRAREVNQAVGAALEARGIPYWGALEEDRALLAVTVQQIADHLGGRWAQEPENADAPVERFLIGGNIMDLGPTYFGRYCNQAVIVRAGRPDIQMAGLMPQTRCLVLTGREEASQYVKAEALQQGVPVILVESNTQETAEALGGILEHASPPTREKVHRFLQLLRGSLDLDARLGQLG